MEGDAELVVTAYNINYSEQSKLLQECRPLHDYSSKNGCTDYPDIIDSN